jgi:hypothetical protein
MQKGIFQYGDLDAQSIIARNLLIADTMTLMGINAQHMTGVYNKIEPWILGKGVGDNDYDYLVPLAGSGGPTIYFQMNMESFLTHYDLELKEAVMQLEGWNYVWEGRNPAIHGGVDCSGLIIWGIRQVYGSDDTPNLNAHGIATSNLTMDGNWGPGSLIFFKNGNSNYYHVSTYLGGWKELEPHGNDGNKRENPANIFVRNRVPEYNNPDVVNKRINWHYLFFTGNNGQAINYF